MNTKTNIYSSLAGLALIAALLTGCSTGTSAQPSAEPSTAASTATAAATPSATATVANTDSEIPAVVTSAYSSAVTANLIADGDAISSLLWGGGLLDLYGARTADETLMWSPVTDVMTADGAAVLIADVTSTDTDAQNRGLSIAQATSRDGNFGTINGIAYNAATDREGKPILLGTRTSTAGMGLDDRGRVAYTTNWDIKVWTDQNAILTISKSQTLYLLPGADGHWLVDGWASTVITPLAVQGE